MKFYALCIFILRLVCDLYLPRDAAWPDFLKFLLLRRNLLLGFILSNSDIWELRERVRERVTVLGFVLISRFIKRLVQCICTYKYILFSVDFLFEIKTASQLERGDVTKAQYAKLYCVLVWVQEVQYFVSSDQSDNFLSFLFLVLFYDWHLDIHNEYSIHRQRDSTSSLPSHI